MDVVFVFSSTVYSFILENLAIPPWPRPFQIVTKHPRYSPESIWGWARLLSKSLSRQPSQCSVILFWSYSHRESLPHSSQRAAHCLRCLTNDYWWWITCWKIRCSPALAVDEDTLLCIEAEGTILKGWKVQLSDPTKQERGATSRGVPGLKKENVNCLSGRNLSVAMEQFAQRQIEQSWQTKGKLCLGKFEGGSRRMIDAMNSL